MNQLWRSGVCLLAAALSGCVYLPLPKVRVGGVEISPGVAFVINIRGALRKLRADLPAIRARLRPASCGSEDCYAAADVAAAVASLRARLREAIPAEALPLRVALEKELEAVTSVQDSIALDGIQLVSLRAAKTGYSVARIDPLFDHFMNLLDRLAAAPELAPTVTISSEPAGATFEIEIPGTAVKKRTYRTNDKVPSVWRSVYQTTTRKEGYRDARYTLDLMNDDRTRVVCALVPANDSANSTCRVQ